MTKHDPEAVRAALSRVVTQARTYRDVTERTRAIARAYVVAADHLTAGRQAVRDADTAAVASARRMVLTPRSNLVTSTTERQASAERLDRYVTELRAVTDPAAIHRRIEDADRTGNELLALAAATVALERVDNGLAVAASRVLDPDDRHTTEWDLVWNAAAAGQSADDLLRDALIDHLDPPAELAGLSTETIRSIARQTDTPPPAAPDAMSAGIAGVAGVVPAATTKALNDPDLERFHQRWPDMIGQGR